MHILKRSSRKQVLPFLSLTYWYIGFPRKFHQNKDVKSRAENVRVGFGDVCVNGHIVQRNWKKKKRIVQAGELMRHHVLFPWFDNHVISRDATTPPALGWKVGPVTPGQGDPASQATTYVNMKQQLPLWGRSPIYWYSVSRLLLVCSRDS